MESAYQSQENKEIAKALFNVQRHLSPAPKDAENTFTKSTYATLKSVMDTCRDVLAENGIWLCQYPVPVDAANSIGLVTKLTHVDSGQWQSSLAVVPLPKADPQGMGSAITYARRYALTAMLGMVMEDDDGNAASYPTKASANGQRGSKPNQQNYGYGDHSSKNGKKPTQTNAPFGLPPDIPQLDGVLYRVLPDETGREYVVASGNTHPKKEILQGAGFHWDPHDKVWWRYLNAA